MENDTYELKNKYKAKLGIRLSRVEKRKAERELEQFKKEVQPFIDEFESQLFDDTITRSYNEIYSSFLETIKLTCEQLNRFSFEIIHVNPYFFHHAFKPLELK